MKAATRCKTTLLISCLLLGWVPAVAARAGGGSSYWKNRIVFPDEPFRAPAALPNEPRWVKFTILLPPYDPNVVYFQDCREYTFHYDFATEWLTPFLGMSRRQFDEATLYEETQQAVLGAVLMPPDTGWPPPPEYPEYGIQFVRRDPYPREQIALMFDVVKSSVISDPAVQAFYFPAYEQIAAAEAEKDWFGAHGIPVSSAGRWARGNACYSTGWALGRLKFFEGHNIKQAYQIGLLEPNDILLTDGVPAEVPFVAGIISLSPSTPNSHVAILARTFNVPFVHLALPEDAQRARELVGHKVVLSAFEQWEQADIRLIDIEGVLDDQSINEILALKQPPDLDITPIEHYGAYSAPADSLLPSDIRYFGGKAANFGILRRSIPANSPVAVAFSFDLWSEFLDQPVAGSGTLRQAIDARLSGYTYPPRNMAALSAELAYIRAMFTNELLTTFTQAQKDAVIAALQDPRYGFDAARKIRFRSSTNVEDSNHFTGAGLYDSFSGCLADELDGDEIGPSICDPNRANERGVFRAIRKVFASFYNDNAFLERLRHGIDESSVGMALLVHHSFPDEIELANGVATLEKGYSRSWQIELVTQAGAVSVANAEDGSIPEEVSAAYYSSGQNPSIYLTLVRPSNLVQLGATVLDWDQDYRQLCELLVTAAVEFNDVTAGDFTTLDFEYKKVAPTGKLVVKQIRQVPTPDDSKTITPFVINEPSCFCLFQGEHGEVFGYHRLKSIWRLQSRSMWLAGANLDQGVLAHIDLEYLAGGRIRAVSGAPSALPFASHGWEDIGGNRLAVTDAWSMHHLANPRRIWLRLEGLPSLVSPAESPIVTLKDFGTYGYPSITVGAEYDRPVPAYDHRFWPDGLGETTSDSARLWPCPKPQQQDQLQRRVIEEKGVKVETSFYWPPPPAGPIAGYTAPLVRWAETTITGLISRPIVLHGWYSQTYQPGHHNFWEHFLFEPRLEPGIDPQILDELRNRRIRFIYAFYDYNNRIVRTFGFDDEPFLAADIDNDDDVDFKDFALFAGRWLDVACDTCGGADLTGDGRVSLEDFDELGLEWNKAIAQP